MCSALKGSEWIWEENRECLLLDGVMPPVLVAGMGWFALVVHLLPIVGALEGVVDRTL